jgi:hypothetical protein
MMGIEIKNLITKFAIENIINRLFNLLLIPFIKENVIDSLNIFFHLNLKNRQNGIQFILEQINRSYHIDSIVHYIDTEPEYKGFNAISFNLVREDIPEYYNLTMKINSRIINEDYDRSELLSKMIYFSINHLTSFCICCGDPHNELANVNFYAPCMKEICNHQYKTIEFKDLLKGMIQSNLEVSDIKLSIYYEYLKSKLVIDNLNKLDDDLVQFQKKFDIVYNNISEIVNDMDLIDLNDIENLNPKQKHLLLYILTLYQIHGHINGHRRGKKYVFEYMNINVEYLINFTKTLKEECIGENVILAYHGTNSNVLHNILKVGLLNMSKTIHQTSGSAYGNGVYLGKESTALSYSRAFKYIRKNSIIDLTNTNPLLEVELSCPDKFYNSGLNGIFVVNSEYGKQSNHILINKLILLTY